MEYWARKNMDGRNLMFAEDLAQIFPQPSLRRASFPFCSPDLALLHPMTPLPERWQGIYGSILNPPKPAAELEDDLTEKYDHFCDQKTEHRQKNAIMAVSSTSIESFNDFLVQRKFSAVYIIHWLILKTRRFIKGRQFNI